MEEWVDSIERDIEIIEGQLMMAKATGCRAVAIPVKTLKRILTVLCERKVSHEPEPERTS